MSLKRFTELFRDVYCIVNNKHVTVARLVRTFRRLDENGDKRIDFAEFESTLDDHGVNVDTATKRQCFDKMDLDGSGAVNFDEFLIAMRVRIFEIVNDVSNCHKSLRSRQ